MSDQETVIIEYETPTHPFELIVEDQPKNGRLIKIYRVRWCNDNTVFLANIPDAWLDLIPYMVARKLLELGHNLDRLLIVKLRGADFELMRATLGVVAATPLLNTAKPVTEPTHYLYWNYPHADVEIS